jgi:hypothetical protein
MALLGSLILEGLWQQLQRATILTPPPPDFSLPSSSKHASFRRFDGTANSKEMISDDGIQCIVPYQLIHLLLWFDYHETDLQFWAHISKPEMQISTRPSIFVALLVCKDVT